jgi:hypothetical protein
VIPLVVKGTTTPVTYAAADAADAGVTMRASAGGSVIKSVEAKEAKAGDGSGLGAGLAYVLVTFDDANNKTDEVSYKFDLYLTVNKGRDLDSKTTFEGKFAHDFEEVGEGANYSYLDENVPVLKATAYIKELEIDVQKGITLKTKVFKDKKYYAKVTGDTIEGDDDELVTEYPDIFDVYKFDYSGWASTTTVRLNDAPAAKPVYTVNEDGDLEYLGTTSEDLPLASIYYVADAELDIEVVEPGDGEPTADDPAYVAPAESGGDDAPANINDNPGTGC